MSDTSTRTRSPFVTCRGFDHYRAMFNLSAADLGDGPILDCPSGGSTFGLDAQACCAPVVRADPAFALGHEAMRERVAADLDEYSVIVRDRIAQTPETFDFAPIYGDVDGWVRAQHRGVEQFSEATPDSARTATAAALPRLPFADAAFRLTLSSHLLFVYADCLGRDFHVDAICELARVTAGEVRIYPLVTPDAQRSADTLAAACAGLAEVGLRTRREKVAYRVRSDADEMLVVSR